MNDQQIIALYCQRSEAAIYESQRKFDAYCRSIIFRILGSYEDTEECLSDTYLRAWNNIPISKPRNLKAYFGSVARHLALDRYRAANVKRRKALI